MTAKPLPDFLVFQECGRYVTSRLTHHAYSHLECCELFLCPKCDMGNFSRNLVAKHLKDAHNCTANPTDNRLKFAHEIKEMIRKCYPTVFVDAPIPTAAEVEKLKKSLNLGDDDVALEGGEEAAEDRPEDEEVSFCLDR